MIQWIETFIIMNPWEAVIFMFVVCTFFGMYMEDVFKIWNWGPQCHKCKEWGFWNTSVSHCNDCYKKELQIAFEVGKYGEDLT